MKNNSAVGGAILVIMIVVGISWLAWIGTMATRSSNKVTTDTQTVTETIKYDTRTVEDGNLEYGKTEVRTKGVDGKKEVTYRVTKKNDIITDRALVSSTITEAPVDEVIAKGTKTEWKCKDTTSYDRNAYNDNYCVNSQGQGKYVADSEAEALDPSYRAGKAGAYYYNNK